MSDDANITLIPVGLLKKYTNDRERVNIPDQGFTVLEILAEIGIPSALVSIAAVNGRHVMKDYVPQAGDVLKLISVIGGG
ncbi:MAG: MoaD/ThiS family protein [Chloroflexota bacterium]|nr:MoaD/ThiS family protein [Chloroflexota bacterium]